MLQAADDEDGTVGPGWLNEIEARIAQIDTGEVDLMDADVADELILAELASKN